MMKINVNLSLFVQNPEPPVSIQTNTSQGGHNQSIDMSNSYQIPPPNFMIPDLSKPPPGFNAPPPVANIAQCQPTFTDVAPVTPVVAQEETKPTVPYYELPAGLMVPLIRLEDYSYHPLDPEDIRLPPPAPPSERLLQAIEAFYSLPSHDRPRDG